MIAAVFSPQEKKNVIFCGYDTQTCNAGKKITRTGMLISRGTLVTPVILENTWSRVWISRDTTHGSITSKENTGKRLDFSGIDTSV